MPGTHAQNVIFVALDDLQDAPATSEALGEAPPAAGAAPPELLLPPPPQAARVDRASTPAAT
ncbi:MAG TPA: hypothetical protein VH912_08850 [Streptosporangiaceae bacterium]